MQKSNTLFVYYLSLTILPALLLDTFKKGVNVQYVNELLILTIFILNLKYTNPYILLTLYTVSIGCVALLYTKPYYIITSFFIMGFALFSTNNFIFLFFQIIAYLSYLFKNIIAKKQVIDGLEFIIDDINQNVSNFLSFTTNFLDTISNKEHEKKISNSIKILIEFILSIILV